MTVMVMTTLTCRTASHRRKLLTLRKMRTMTTIASILGRSTAMCAKMEAMSCAVRVVQKSPITSVSDSRWLPEATGGARIAQPNGQLPRKSKRITG